MLLFPVDIDQLSERNKNFMELVQVRLCAYVPKSVTGNAEVGGYKNSQILR